MLTYGLLFTLMAKYKYVWKRMITYGNLWTLKEWTSIDTKRLDINEDFCTLNSGHFSTLMNTNGYIWTIATTGRL